ncbi:ATP-binding cassette domain-containing protein, partial [Oceanithermus profundus]
MLEARGLHFGYPQGPRVLAGVELRLEPGTWLAVLGPNGSGKTTLLALLLGLLRPSAGEVRLDGRALHAWSGGGGGGGKGGLPPNNKKPP